MIEKLKHLKIGEKEYPVIFNLNVMEKIQEKYGSIEKWGELTDNKGKEVNIGALKFGVLEMINEGIDIENEDAEEKRKFLTDIEVGRIITDFGVQKIAEKVNTTVIESTKVEENEKNA